MKLKKTMIPAFAIALIAATGVSAYAASPELRGTVGSIFADIQTYAEGEMPDIPAGAVMLNKDVADETVSADANLKVYDEDEMPSIPDGAELLKKVVVEE
ncbi:hypothetical protein [Lacrimispora brassicae]